MSIKKKVLAAVTSGLAIAGIVAATTLAFPQLSSAQTTVTGDTATTTTATERRGGPGGRGEMRGGMGDNDQYLAEALGITEDELATARTTAREAAIQQAVKDGLITQEQADGMLSGTGKVRIDLRGIDVDQDALLAEALGISVDKLQEAQQSAFEAQLAQAVTDGRVTQAQADQLKAERALQQYIVDKGLYTSAVQAAVKDGVITQAQADTILSQSGRGLFGGHGFDGGMGGRGGHH